jgi:branched-chain amino acid aminotransferase
LGAPSSSQSDPTQSNSKTKPTDHDRAAPRGVGSTKAAGNYAPCFNAQASAKAAGFDDVLYLDSQERRYVEEVAASNFFVVRDGVAHTPSLGTILPGVTRRSVIELLRTEVGMEVVEGQVDIRTAMEEGASEAFCVGTGASVSPIGSITNGDAVAEYSYGDSGYGPVAEKVLSLLSGIQGGTMEDKRGWVYRVQAN